MRPCFLLLCLLALNAPAYAQTAVVGVALEAGPAYHRTNGLGSFANDYNEAFAADIVVPFDGIRGLRGYEVAGRFIVVNPRFYFSGGGGISRMKAADRVRLRDDGGRDLDLDVNDTFGEIEISPNTLVSAVIGATVRTTTLTSVRRFSNGTTDADDSTPASPLSGTFDGDAFNVYAGLSFNRHLPLTPDSFMGIRAAVTYPFLQSKITEQELTRGDTTFPDRYTANGPPAEARPVRANMGGLMVSLHLSFGLRGWL